MTHFCFNTAEDFKDTRFWTRLQDIIEMLALPVPTIKGYSLKKFQKEGLWAIRVHHSGRESPPTEDIRFKFVYSDKTKGINVAMQELIGRLCGRHYPELKRHYTFSFGRRDEEGLAYEFADGIPDTPNPVRQHFQDL